MSEDAGAGSGSVDFLDFSCKFKKIQKKNQGNSIGFEARPRIFEDFRRFSKQIHEWPARLELPARPRPSKKSRPSPARSKISEISELSQPSRPPKKSIFSISLDAWKGIENPTHRAHGFQCIKNRHRYSIFLIRMTISSATPQQYPS